MYDRTYWQDHVLSESGKYVVVRTDGGDNVFMITPFGEVMQQGTSQDAAHFNKVEEALVSHELAITLLMNHSKQQEWNQDDIRTAVSSETGTVTLTNSARYPFNNSQKTVALKAARPNAQYVVVTQIAASSGNVGEIEVSDILENGFKLAFTGSATSVTVKYNIIGGYMI